MKIVTRSSKLDLREFKLNGYVLDKDVDPKYVKSYNNTKASKVLDYKENYIFQHYLNKNILEFLEAFGKWTGPGYNVLKRISMYNEEDLWPFVDIEEEQEISYIKIYEPCWGFDDLIFSTNPNIYKIKEFENYYRFNYKYQKRHKLNFINTDDEV